MREMKTTSEVWTYRKPRKGKSQCYFQMEAICHSFTADGDTLSNVPLFSPLSICHFYLAASIIVVAACLWLHMYKLGFHQMQ